MSEIKFEKAMTRLEKIVEELERGDEEGDFGEDDGDGPVTGATDRFAEMMAEEESD